jgi:protein PsiE
MLKTVRALCTATVGAHRAMKDLADAVGTFLVDAFHLLALFAIGGTTVWSAAATFADMVAQGRARLEDILLLFIYLEIGAMVGIYFKTTHLPVRYLIYIAITALGRVLIEVVGAEHRTGTDLLVVAGSILLLSIAVLVLRFGSYKFPSANPDTDMRTDVRQA